MKKTLTIALIVSTLAVTQIFAFNKIPMASGHKVKANCDEISALSIEKFIAYNKASTDGNIILFLEIINAATDEEVKDFQCLSKKELNIAK